MAKLLDLDPLPHPPVKYKFAPMFPFKQKKLQENCFQNLVDFTYLYRSQHMIIFFQEYFTFLKYSLVRLLQMCQICQQETNLITENTKICPDCISCLIPHQVCYPSVNYRHFCGTVTQFLKLCFLRRFYLSFYMQLCSRGTQKLI